MKSSPFLIASSILALAACQGGTESAVSAEQLVGTRWLLESADGESFSTAERRPELGFAEGLSINGLAGCNRFFGEAKLEEGRLSTGPLGMTRMACPPPLDELESTLLRVLGEGCEIEIRDDRLTLNGSGHTLVYARGEAGE